MKRTIFMAMVLALLAGCAPAKPDLSSRRNLAVQIDSANSTRIRDVAVFDAAGGAVVTGKVRKLHEFKLPGHVDVRLCAPDGSSELVQGKIRGHTSRRSGAREAIFKAKLQISPPAGAIIRVRYHSAGDDSEHGLRCAS